MGLLKPWRMPLYPLIVAREKLARGERTREVGGEPAVMDEPQGVAEYDAFGTAGEVGVHELSARAISRLLPEGGTLVDLGCGSGRLLARLARGRPDARIVGFDLSEPMLDTARRLMEREGLAERVELRRADIATFDAGLSEEPDVVSCNFALHHLPDEEVAGRCLEAIARVRSRTGCAVWIFDFARLRHPGSWPAVASMIRWPGPVVHSDAIESERAAFSEAELIRLIERSGLDDLHHVRSRPLGENQAHWAAGRDRRAPVTGLWRQVPLPRESRLVTRLALQSFPRSLAQT
ncbi:MAG TPA: methyltransferase domain-containing protein [Solirubrobacteraceae bacterium]|nr:methyltransferase domain-containing protein [Solirubrobacteraceae bacterium]